MDNNKYRNKMTVEERMRILANHIIDKILSMTPEERKKIDGKIKKTKDHLGRMKYEF